MEENSEVENEGLLVIQLPDKQRRENLTWHILNLINNFKVLDGTVKFEAALDPEDEYWIDCKEKE